MRSPGLPIRLRYLQPVLDQLRSVPNGELNEDTDTSFLESVIRKRVEGLQRAQAKRILKADIEALGEWLAKEAVDQPGAHFIFAWVMGAQGWMLGSEDSVELVSDLLTDLPPAPPGASLGRFRKSNRLTELCSMNMTMSACTSEATLRCRTRSTCVSRLTVLTRCRTSSRQTTTFSRVIVSTSLKGVTISLPRANVGRHGWKRVLKSTTCFILVSRIGTRNLRALVPNYRRH